MRIYRSTIYTIDGACHSWTLVFSIGRSVWKVSKTCQPGAYFSNRTSTRQHAKARCKVWVVQKLKTDQSLEKHKKRVEKSHGVFNQDLDFFGITRVSSVWKLTNPPKKRHAPLGDFGFTLTIPVWRGCEFLCQKKWWNSPGSDDFGREQGGCINFLNICNHWCLITSNSMRISISCPLMTTFPDTLLQIMKEWDLGKTFNIHTTTSYQNRRFQLTLIKLPSIHKQLRLADLSVDRTSCLRGWNEVKKKRIRVFPS